MGPPFLLWFFGVAGNGGFKRWVPTAGALRLPALRFPTVIIM